MKHNLTQGAIGDCYFISYLHALKREKPMIFKSIIRDFKPEGYVEVNFFIEDKNNNIEEIVVFVDDYIPCRHINEFLMYPIFSRYKYYLMNKEDKEIMRYQVGIYISW